MSIKISCENFESFIGDVRPLWLISDSNLKFEKIKWSQTGDSVMMKSLDGCNHGAFAYGVFLTFVKAGESTIVANYDGKDYICKVTSRERKAYTGKEKLNYYKGDFHTHTTPEHVHDKYLTRSDFLPSKYLGYIKDENLRDVAVMTDHSETIDLENFFKNFTEYELMSEDMEPIVYPGCENEIMYTELDRFGKRHRLSGELITLNASSFNQANTYPEFFFAFENNPYAIGIFAHPHVVGISTKGVWNYRPRLNNPKELTDLIKYVEVLNSPRHDANLLNEYVYSEALDGGYRVSTTLGSDMHRDWDFSTFPGATIIMATEKSREAITDALLNLRAYASESGNIKLSYKVNGMEAPCDLPIASKYHFEVKIDYFTPDNTTRPIRCEVISDEGKTIKIIENAIFENFEFDIESDSARWFYLKFTDSQTYRTFSPPVFCSREPVPYVLDSLKPIDKSYFTATDENGRDASALIDNDTETEWTADGTSFSITVDMKKEYTVRALGNYAAPIDIKQLRANGIHPNLAEAKLPADYEIYTSLDGKNFNLISDGVFRSFAGEEIILFEPCKARFIKFDILSTTGSRLGRDKYKDIPASLAEISIFE